MGYKQRAGWLHSMISQDDDDDDEVQL